MNENVTADEAMVTATRAVAAEQSDPIPGAGPAGSGGVADSAGSVRSADSGGPVDSAGAVGSDGTAGAADSAGSVGPVDSGGGVGAGDPAGAIGSAGWWRSDASESTRRNLGLVGVLAALIIIGVITRPDLYSDADWVENNVFTILKLASVVGVVAVGMTFVIIGGGIDLSVGAIVALAGVWSTTAATQSYGAGGMIFCALAVGLGVGVVNGILIAYGRLVAFIATLAMMVAARGLAAQISGKQTQVSTSRTINNIASTEILRIPLLVFILAAVAAAGWVLLNRTTFGRRTVAVGGNTEAARLAGINVRWQTLLLYALSGLCCGIAAVMLTSQATSAQAAMANLYELDAIAAAIIGGTLLSGGRGTIVGSVLGVIIFSTITNLFAINGLTTEAQNMVKGGIIVAAVLVQQVRFKSLTQLLARGRTPLTAHRTDHTSKRLSSRPRL